MPLGDEFLLQLRATFMVEAREHGQSLSRGLLQLEKPIDERTRSGLVEAVFRTVHSLKGAARAVEQSDIEAICQALEDVFAGWRREPVVPRAETMDLLYRALDTIEGLLAGPDGGVAAASPAKLMALRKDLRRIGVLTHSTTSDPSPSDAPPTTPRPDGTRAMTPLPGPAFPPAAGRLIGPVPLGALAEDTVRVTLSKLEEQLRRTEDLLVSKLAARERVTELRALDDWFDAWRKNRAEHKALAGTMGLRTFPASTEKPGTAGAGMQRALDLFEAGDVAIRDLEARLAEMRRRAQHDRDQVGKSVDQLRENTQKLLRLPFSSISASFQRLVRDLCRAQGKQADLVIEGDHVELDKRILEEMKDPLVHMLRNAVGHAVELPSLRIDHGKPARATLVLAVSQEDGHRVRIVLSDDGSGIATEQVKATAVQRGVISAEEAAQLEESVAQRLVFRSEISTGVEVTPLSGRGLGLAIVRENTQRLGGKVRVRSTPGQGTRFEITLPALHATFRGILCEAGGRPFLIPVAQVERVARVAQSGVRTVEGRETITLGGLVIALVRLADVLGLPAPAPGTKAARDLQVVVVAGSGEQSLAFAVDQVVDEQEALVKPLRKPLLRVRNVAAVAVLGSGAVVPILHVGDLLLTARQPAAPRALPRPSTQTAPARQILLAEDSITSRLLLKSVLESAGYAVTTAVDGMEALKLLRSRPFDLLVSDVEMPHMDGFDLTRHVRADHQLSRVPVVLVTTLASREHQERGIDVGANAYIVKGSFDQDTLIGAVRRLL
ncbi:MAG: response regulator [Burkholderiaceae bacterium]